MLSLGRRGKKIMRENLSDNDNNYCPMCGKKLDKGACLENEISAEEKEQNNETMQAQ